MAETLTDSSDIALGNSYAQLPAVFYSKVRPTPVATPRLLRLNRPLADSLRLDAGWLRSADGVAMLAGNRVPAGADPLAMVYAGHQFGTWVPRLGDGRAVLLGDLVDRQGIRRDIQLKGAGLTPYSRMGDGRAVLGPVLREYVVSEAMFALGVPTTRALAMVASGEPVFREQPEPGAVLTRVATSHLRVGTFEYFYRRGDVDSLRTLADYAIDRHYPEAAAAENPYRALLEGVIARTAELIAAWMHVGFIHGVMNTDNMSIAGETLDYGPCAFMDAFHPSTVYSFVDQGGRYAYNQQPRIGDWNMMQFAETLLPLLAADPDDAVALAREALEAYPVHFEAAYHAGLRRKIGLAETAEGDIDLINDLLSRMAAQRADFTLTFRLLADARAEDSTRDEPVRGRFDNPESFDAWAQRWRRRLALETRGDDKRRADMRAVNPAFIPRNHQVQRAIDAATRDGDLTVLDELLHAVGTPYEDNPALDRYALPPEPNEVVRRTFCGT